MAENKKTFVDWLFSKRVWGAVVTTYGIITGNVPVIITGTTMIGGGVVDAERKKRKIR